jgi:hypothetical protein
MNRRKSDDDPTALQDILSQLSPDGGWVVKIFRREGGSDSWLSDVSIGEISEQMIAAEYGPGKYLVRPWSESTKKFGSSRIVNISADAAGLKLESVPISFGNSHGSSMDAVAQLQLEGMRMQMALQKDSSDRVYEILLALIAKPDKGGSTTGELAAIVSAMKDLRGPEREFGDQFKEMTTVIEATRALLPSGDGKESGPWGVLGQLLPEVLKARGTPETAPLLDPATIIPPVTLETNAAPQIAASPPQSQQYAAPPPELAGGPMQQQLMTVRTEFLKRLKQASEGNIDPGLIADYIEEMETIEEPCAWILHLVRDDSITWKMIPGLSTLSAQSQGWIKQVYDLLRENHERGQSEAGSIDQARSAGDSGHVDGDGGSGTPGADPNTDPPTAA